MFLRRQFALTRRNRINPALAEIARLRVANKTNLRFGEEEAKSALKAGNGGGLGLERVQHVSVTEAENVLMYWLQLDFVRCVGTRPLYFVTEAPHEKTRACSLNL